MPVVDFSGDLCCWFLRRNPLIAVIAQAILISLGVAIFPLGIAGSFPFVPTFLSVLASELSLLIAGYFVIWRRFPATF